MRCKLRINNSVLQFLFHKVLFVCVCMRVCFYVCESSRPFIIYYRLCMLASDSS